MLSRCARRPARDPGFTLIEVLVTLSVLVVLVAVALPAMGTIISNQRVRTAAGDLHMALLKARSEAMKRNASVTVTPAAANWAQGWVARAADGTAVEVREVQNGVAGTSAVTAVRFGGNGRSTLTGETSSSGSFEFSAPRASEARCVRVDTGGRVSSFRKEGSC